MSKLKKIFKSNIFFIIALFFCVILAFAILNSIYKSKNFFPTVLNNNDTDNVISLIQPSIDTFNSINASTKKCINGLSIDSKNSVDILNTAIDELETLKSSIFSISIKDNPYPNLLSDLCLCINSTQNLYKYCTKSLNYNNNLQSIDVKTELDNLLVYCNESYNKMNNYNIKLELPKSTSQFCDNLVSYLSSMESLTATNNLTTEKYENFINIYNSTLTDFNKLLEDSEPIIEKIREDGRSINVLLDDITSKESSFLEIKNNFNYCSIPKGYMEYYKSLNDIFTLYDKYLSSMKTAIIYEQSCKSYKSSKKSIDKNYKDAFSKYEDVITAIKSLKTPKKN